MCLCASDTVMCENVTNTCQSHSYRSLSHLPIICDCSYVLFWTNKCAQIEIEALLVNELFSCHNTHLADYNLYHFYLHGILQQLLEIYKMARRAFCLSLSFLCALTTLWFANIENWALIRMKSWWNSLMLAQRMLKISDRYTHVWHFK